VPGLTRECAGVSEGAPLTCGGLTPRIRCWSRTSATSQVRRPFRGPVRGLGCASI